METAMLRENGHEVIEYVLDNRELNLRGSLINALRSIWSRDDYHNLRKIIKEHKPALMHVHNSFPMLSPSIYHAARREGIKVFSTLRNYRHICPAATLFRDGNICEDCIGKNPPVPAIKYACYKESKSASMAVATMLAFHRFIRTFENKVDLFIAISEIIRDKHIRGGFDSDKIVVKPNFVHPDPGLRESKGDYAVFAGRLVAEKGVQTLLNAWKLLPANIKLKVIGAGPLEEKAIETAADMRNVDILGYKSRDELYDLFGNSALVIVPSEWYEGFGRTAIEAFAVGTPVIASNLGALNTIIEDGKTGYLFKPGDPEDLARVVRLGFGNKERLREMGEKARAEYEMKYTAASNYTQLMQIYESIITG